MKGQRIAILSSIGLLSFAGPAATAQPAVKRVKYKVSCPACAIELTPVATIGGPSDTASIAPHSFLDRDSQGRFFAIGDDFRVLVYDPRGRLLKTLGRRGNGPGEFNGRGPLGIRDVVVGPGDSVFVFHPPKVTVFSPQLAYVRTITGLPLAQVSNIYPLADGTWLVGGSNNTPEHAGRSLFRINSEGAIRQSLGPEQAVTPDRPTIVGARFRVSPDRRALWINAENYRYSLSQWSIDNRLLGSLEIDDVPYLPEPKSVTRRTQSGRTYESTEGGALTVTGIDSAGQIWTWGKAPQATPFEGILEVVDPRTGEIRVSQKVGAPVWLLRNGELAYSSKVDGDGFMTFVVSKHRVVAR